ncbi:MAG: 30S ribosomal protein S16 [Acidimicrobiia bacterium]
MAVKLRLMRMGKKKHPTYRVVAADSRSPRDGRFIELIGRYDPHPHPSVVEIDNDRALHWLEVGAQPTAAVRKLLEISGAWGQFRVKRGDVHVVGEVALPEDREKKSKKAKAREAEEAEAAAEQAPAPEAEAVAEEPAAEESAVETAEEAPAVEEAAVEEPAAEVVEEAPAAEAAEETAEPAEASESEEEEAT